MSTPDFNISDNYETPDWLFDYLNKRYKFDVDLTADSYSCKVSMSPLHDRGFNALEASWQSFQSVFAFPPFSKPHFFNFLKKAKYESQENGVKSTVIVPIKLLGADYFKKVMPEDVLVIHPRVHFLFNKRMVDRAESICVLHYNRLKSNITPKLEFTDLSNISIRPAKQSY